MKVKELIERLQKENQEDERHIFVDSDLGHTSDEHSKYYARNIIIKGYDINYLYYDGSMIRNITEIKENVMDEYDYDLVDFDSLDKLINEVIKANYKELEGCWITIQP